ncbi:MAG: hypothetical protein GVY29_01910 [Spirochaetes bacterium]|jgi:polyhydroxyalkanoate synthesis regulator phasin|nr:hypothetical protein [Spirochaetota bacterium]
MSRLYLAIFAVLMLLLAVPSGFGQAETSELELAALDFSEAAVSLAGPRAFYIRKIQTAEGRFSVRLASSEGETWRVVEVYPESQNILPNDVILDVATLEVENDATLRIDGVFVEDDVYSIRLREADGGYALVDGIQSGTLAAVDEERAQPLIDLVVEEVVSTELADARARIEELRAERDQAAEQAERLSAENMGLVERNEALTRQVRELKAENSRLKSDIAELREELKTARVDAGAEPASGAVDQTLSEAQSLERAAAEIDESLQQIDQAIQRLGSTVTANHRELLEEIEDAQSALVGRLEGVTDGDVRTDAPHAPDGDTGGRIDELQRRVADLQERQEVVREELLQEVAEGQYVTLLSEDLTSSVLEGFDGGEGQIGSWGLNEGTLRQRDPKQYFAKYLIDVPQTAQRTLYRFSTRSLDDGWVGVGLHIFVSSVDKRGYGLGDSLLIWFTRDPSVYGTNNTFLQVYRSSDDVNMGRVAGAMISEPIAESLQASVLYEPETGYLTIAVNGEDKIRYRAWFDINRGVQIAFRSLGRALFSDFSVQTLPEATSSLGD